MRTVVQKFQLRQLLFFVALILLSFLILKNLGRFGVFIDLIKNVNIVVLSLILPIRYLSYWTNTRYFEKYFSIMNKKIEHRRLFRAVIAMNFVNTVFPLGSISGTTFLARELKDEVSSKTTTIGQVVYQGLSAVAYLSFMVIAFVLLLLSNQINRAGFRFILFLVFGIIIAGVVVLLLILNRKLSESILLISTRPVNAILRRFGKNSLSKKNLRLFIDEFYTTGTRLLKDYKSLEKPFWYVWQGVFWEVASIYVVALAFQQIINPGVIIAAYIMSLLFSLLSIFTAGVGVYEATMVAVFVALGLPFTSAVSITIVYRVMAMWIFLPFGLWAYRGTALGAKNGK